MPGSDAKPPLPEAQQLLARFFHHLDASDYEKVAGLFYPDGVFQRRGQELRGAREIVDALRGRSDTLVGHHVMTNVFVDPVGADRARFSSYLTVYRFDDGRRRSGPAPLSGPAAIALCTGEMSRGEGGWLFERLDVGSPTMAADVRE